MRVSKIVFLLSMMFLSHAAMAAYKDTSNVTIQLISVWTSSGDILVQTNPKPDITGLTCTNDYWLTLDKDDLGYQATLSMLLSAQATQRKVNISAQDNNGDQFCKLRRVITLAN